MVKLLKVSYDDSTFERIKSVKEASGLRWGEFILEKCLDKPTARASTPVSERDVQDRDLGRMVPCEGCGEPALGMSLTFGLCEGCAQGFRPCLGCGKSLKGEQAFIKRCGDCYAASKLPVEREETCAEVETPISGGE